MADCNLTAARLRELLDYNPETGKFTRKVRTAQRHQVGDRADFLVTGGNAPGYHRVSVDSLRYQAHRVAWLYVHGEWPKQDIDHINGDRSDNRIANLRDVSRTVNLQNMRSARKDNSHGFLGVCWHPETKKWVARINVGEKCHSLGLHETPELAHQAYLVAKRKLHEGCTI